MSSIDSKVMRYLHGLPVIFDDICVIHSPRLHDIATEGLDKFYQYISFENIICSRKKIEMYFILNNSVTDF